jgi:hypothetical protein
MDFADGIAALAARIEKQAASLETEEACKTAFVMPFLKALGYDVFDPDIVIPEFTADHGVKKGEKVDYACKVGSHMALLVEVKPCRSDLSTKHMSQLYRYFSVTEARFALLTNGMLYWFFTDLDESNKMDARPFFEFDICDYRDRDIDELRKFHHDSFDEGSILATASNLKYGSAICREVQKELDDPSDEFERMLISRVYDGKRLTQGVREDFRPLVRQAIRDAVRERINARLTSAIEVGAGAPDLAEDEVRAPDGEIVTTQDEIDGFNIIRAIVREVIAPERVTMRDAKTYCSVLIDNNNRRLLARLWLNRSKWYISLFDGEKTEEKVQIERLDDIFKHGDKLKQRARIFVEIDA